MLQTIDQKIQISAAPAPAPRTVPAVAFACAPAPAPAAAANGTKQRVILPFWLHCKKKERVSA